MWCSVQERHVGEQGRHGAETRARERAGDLLRADVVHEIGPEHRERRQERHAHGGGTEAQAEGEVAPLLELDAARLHVRRARPAELISGTVRVICARMNYWPDARDAEETLQRVKQSTAALHDTAALMTRLRADPADVAKATLAG